MNNNFLVVSEKFYSIQGEGQTMGIPAVFLRLAGCNLLCKSKSWICDSIEVWQKGTKTMFSDVLNDDYIDRLRNGAHLVITGGEPMLHQKKIIDYIEWFFIEYNFKPTIEIETNGTIIPKDEMFEIVDYWNCSPKLSNSGETKPRRFNEIALKEINDQENSIFKFVINNEGDVLEMINEFGNFDMTKFVLMPSGESQDELNISRPVVLEQCKKLNLRYSDRLHIVGWNMKTGV
jgi:organic radical activating enzyme